MSCFYSLLFIITLQKFKNELKKNREKILGDAESSSKTKKKEVHIFLLSVTGFHILLLFQMHVPNEFSNYSCMKFHHVSDHISPNSDQDQFFLNDIHTLSRDLVMRIYKMNTYCLALIFYQILSTHSLRKYIKISLENLYVDIMVTYCIFYIFFRKRNLVSTEKKG